MIFAKRQSRSSGYGHAVILCIRQPRPEPNSGIERLSEDEWRSLASPGYGPAASPHQGGGNGCLPGIGSR